MEKLVNDELEASLSYDGTESDSDNETDNESKKFFNEFD